VILKNFNLLAFLFRFTYNKNTISKGSIMKRLSTLLIIIGLIIFAIPIVGRVYTSHEQNRMYEEYLEQLETQADMAGVDLNAEIMDGGFSDEIVGTDPPALKQNKSIIGRISIPAIESDQLLLEGSSGYQLRWGAGHIPETAPPGAIGNCGIAGHRNYTFGSYFSRLDELIVGDAIIVTYLGTDYTYTVNEILVVLPDETSVLSQPNNEKRITLITCTPKGSNTHRLIVHGLIADAFIDPLSL